MEREGRGLCKSPISKHTFCVTVSTIKHLLKNYFGSFLPGAVLRGRWASKGNSPVAQRWVCHKTYCASSETLQKLLVPPWLTNRVRDVVSDNWLGSWSLHLVLMSTMELFFPFSQGFVLWDHFAFLGLQLKHNWDKDIVLVWLKTLVSVINRFRSLFLKLLNTDQNLVVLSA